MFQRYNWGYLAGVEDGLDSTPIILSLGAVIVLEGCSTLNATLDEYYNVSVWLDTPPQESYRRGVTRDIEEYKLDPTRVHSVLEEWARWEVQDSAMDERRRRADFIL